MQKNQFKKLLSIYGPQIERWPNIRPEEAYRLLDEDQELRDLFEEEKKLDDKLDLLNAPTDLPRSLTSKGMKDMMAHKDLNTSYFSVNDNKTNILLGSALALAAIFFLFFASPFVFNSAGNAPQDIDLFLEELAEYQDPDFADPFIFFEISNKNDTKDIEEFLNDLPEPDQKDIWEIFMNEKQDNSKT